MKWYLLVVCVILLGQGEATPVKDVQPGARQGLFRATGDVEYVKDGEEQNDYAGGNDEDGDEENGDDDENGEDGDEENGNDDENYEDDDEENDYDNDGEDDENNVAPKKESFWERYNARKPKHWKRMSVKRRRRYKEEIMEKAEKHGRSKKKVIKRILGKAKMMMDIGKELKKGSHEIKEAGQAIRSMAGDVSRIVNRFRSD